MWEALEIEKGVVRRWWELLYPAHLLNVSHGELGWAVFQSFTAKPPKTNSWQKTPKAQLCAFGGASRSHKDHRRHQRATDTQLLWGFVAADMEEYAQLWTAPLCRAGAAAEVADLPAVTWVALMVWREGESTGALLPPPVQSCAGAWAVLFGPSEPPLN